MKEKTIETFNASSDVISLLEISRGIGWNTVREQSIQRIIYFAKVFYSFVSNETYFPFESYHFSTTFSGPYSELINRSIAFLRSKKIITEDEEGNIILNEGSQAISESSNDDTSSSAWLKIIIYILSLYGENRIYNFIIHDPLYKEAIATNTQKELDTGIENTSISVLNQFRTAFEETLEDTSSIDEKEYLELYFEYIFSKIITQKG